MKDTSLFWRLFGVGVLLYFLSFVGYVFPILNTVLFVLIVLGVLFYSFKDLRIGVFAVLFEVAIGVKGYLFSVNLFGFPVSLRLALFVGVFLIWLYLVWRGKYEARFAGSKLFPVYALFTFVILLGVASGLANGNDVKNIFFDMNGYLYLAFIFPVYDVIRSKELLKKAMVVVLAGGFALSAFSLFTALEFTVLHQDSRPDLAEAISSELAIDDEDEEDAFEKVSHSVTAKDELKDSLLFMRSFENSKPPIYRWTQDVSVAEISYMAGPFFRVFSPGQLYSLVAFFVAGILLFRKWFRKEIPDLYIPDIDSKLLGVIAGVSVVTVLLGFSRSLWIGLVLGGIVTVFMMKKQYAWKVASVGVLSVLILAGGMRIAAPDAFELLQNRVVSIFQPSSESAGSNRVNVLGPAIQKAADHWIVGSGYGTTVEYESVVPEKYGTLRVFAFEWSYLDMIIEVGLFGLLVYILFILKVLKQLSAEKIIFWGVVIIALMITNVTTPYLNHPLGIALLLLAARFSEGMLVGEEG